MNSVIRVGIDLAKNTFSVFGVDVHEHIVFEKTLRRAELFALFSNLPTFIVAMEAGSGAHHWARKLRDLGRDARIIDPWRDHYDHVRPHRSLGKKPPAVFAQEAA